MMAAKNLRKAQLKDLSSSLSKDELMRRLKTVAQQLSNADQEDDVKVYDKLAASLVMPHMMYHKDKDVKLYTACCLADILRLYAPEPPYNEDQLKSIFTLLVNQLKGIDHPGGASYQRHFYLLESLALVKTFNICMELDAQEIIINLFKVFFEAINPKHNVKVKTFMLDVMCPIIQEGDSLPRELLDSILINLTKQRKKSNNDAYKLAADLVNKTSASIEPYIQLFFNNALVLGQEVESEVSEHLFDLVYELNKINRSVLLSVLPQLEFKLKSREEDDRMQMVHLLSRMFSDEASDLAEQNKALWKSFLGRFVDISAEIRIACVESAKVFLTSCPQLVDEISDCLHERFHDTDERVRLETVVCVCEACAENMDAVPEKLLDDIRERMRDKKWSIRREALTCVGKLYKRLTTGSDINLAWVKKIKWAPNKLLCGYYQNSIDDRLCIERILHGCIVPVTIGNKERMSRLLKLYAGFDELAMTAFNNILKHRAKMNADLKTLLEVASLDESTDKEKLLHSRIISLARSLPDPFKSQEHLKKFVALFSDKALHKNLSNAVDIKKGCPQVMKSITEVVKSLSQRNILETVKALLDQCCPMMLDSQSLLVLFELVKEALDGLDDDEEDVIETDDSDHVSDKAKKGLMLIQVLSSTVPEIFHTKEIFQYLLIFIKHSVNFVVETTLHTLCAIANGLEDFDKGLSSCFIPVLKSIAINGSKKQASFSVRALSKLLKDPNAVLGRLLNSLVENLTYESPNLLSVLASLGEIAVERPSVFEKKYKDIVREFVVKDLIVKDRESTADSQESEDEWCPEDQLPRETKIKVQGIKLLTQWLCGLQSDHKSSALPAFRLLDTLLKNRGDLNGKDMVGPHSRSHLRLAAAKGLIKVMQCSSYTDAITLEQYQQLALVVQDSCYEVRQKLAVKLHKALVSFRLPLAYLAFFVLSAVDPSNDRKAQVRQMLAKNAQVRRDFLKQHSSAAARPFSILPEYALPYAIHLLAHHPDFDNRSKDSLQETKEYLLFFLDAILGNKTDSHSFIKKMVEKIKQTNDAKDIEYNDKLYTVCDLAIAIIVSKSNTIVLKDFAGNPVLPKRLFTPATDKKSNSLKNYLPKDFIVSPGKPVKSVFKVETKATPSKQIKRRPKQKPQPPKSKVIIEHEASESSDEDDDLPLSTFSSPEKAKQLSSAPQDDVAHALGSSTKQTTMKSFLTAKDDAVTKETEDSDSSSGNEPLITHRLPRKRNLRVALESRLSPAVDESDSNPGEVTKSPESPTAKRMRANDEPAPKLNVKRRTTRRR